MKRFVLLILLAVLCSFITFLVTEKHKEKKLSKIARAAMGGLSLLAVIIDLLGLVKGSSNEIDIPLPTSNPPPAIHSSIPIGKFEQDNDLNNGEETIEWIILSTDSEYNKLLLLSQKGLLYKPFEESGVAHVWGGSSLRNWLNEDFLNSAFSEEERACILLQESLLTERSSTFTTPIEDSYSDDYVFCLSIQEVDQYFHPRESRVCIPTAYAKTTFAGDRIQPEGDHWWLRNPGTSLSEVACVRGEGQPGEKPGTINEFGCHSNGGGTLVRPAMWISWGAYLTLCEQN